MRNEENIDHIDRSERAITSLSLTYNKSIFVNSSFINGSKKHISIVYSLKQTKKIKN